jgi:hypothetical protein
MILVACCLSISGGVAPFNDQCVDAPIVAVSATGSTVNANDHPELGGLNCGVDFGSGGPGVWYQVAGTGRELTASTCSRETDFDTRLSIFTGTCNAPQCEEENDDHEGAESACEDGNEGLSSTVSWMSEDGATYNILVRTRKSFFISLLWNLRSLFLTDSAVLASFPLAICFALVTCFVDDSTIPITIFRFTATKLTLVPLDFPYSRSGRTPRRRILARRQLKDPSC